MWVQSAKRVGWYTNDPTDDVGSNNFWMYLPLWKSRYQRQRSFLCVWLHSWFPSHEEIHVIFQFACSKFCLGWVCTIQAAEVKEVRFTKGRYSRGDKKTKYQEEAIVILLHHLNHSMTWLIFLCSYHIHHYKLRYKEQCILAAVNSWPVFGSAAEFVTVVNVALLVKYCWC